MVIGIAILMTIFLTRPAKGQDTPKKENKTTVKVKIIKDENGKETIIDTTFTTPDFDSKELEEVVEQFQEGMKEADNELDHAHQMYFSMEFPDSAFKDSLHKIKDKVIVLKKGLKDKCVTIRRFPHGYNFEYDIPCPPECPRHSRNIERFDWSENPSFSEKGIFRLREHSQTLNDILGDIPMDKVKNYSIKNTKYGKRIVIDIED